MASRLLAGKNSASKARVTAVTVAVSEHVLFLKDRRTADVLAVESYLGEVPCLDLDALVLIAGGFGAVPYWSSSENDTNNAWVQNFDNGNQNTNNKNNTRAVRCVRDLKIKQKKMYRCERDLLLAPPNLMSLYD